MAQKRMFDKSITNSDAFLELPDSSQVLYFHLNMNADDDGFVNNWKSIIRMIGVKEDDLKLLITKSFVIPFESGVVVIRHWRINNYLRKDRYVETNYKDEFSRLSLSENGEYTIGNQLGIPLVYPDKNSIEENSIDKNINNNKINKKESDSEIISDYYQQEMGQLPSPTQYEKLYYYLDKLDVSLIKHSIDIAVNNNVKKMSYIEAILKDYVENGYKSIDDLPDFKKEPIENDYVENEDLKELEDFNWLDS